MQPQLLPYVIHFDDGGSALYYSDEPPDVGAELLDGGARFRVERVEPPTESAFGHAWASRVEWPIRRTFDRRPAGDRDGRASSWPRIPSTSSDS